VESISGHFTFADATSGLRLDWPPGESVRGLKLRVSAISNSHSTGARNCGDDVENTYK